MSNSKECSCPWMFPGHTALGWMIGCKCEAAPSRAKEREKKKPDEASPEWEANANYPQWLYPRGSLEGVIPSAMKCVHCGFVWFKSHYTDSQAFVYAITKHDNNCHMNGAP